jgi:hypothetical protein
MSLQKQIEDKLQEAMLTFYDFLSYLRLNYTCDELWDGKEVLKLRRAGKTLITICIKDGFFQVIIIFGKAEREKFEKVRNSFSKQIRKIFDDTKTYHDGKWMTFSLKDDTYLQEIQELLKIKKRPNRQPEDLKNAILGKCCRRCDTCAVYYQNRAKGSDFSIGAEKIYEDEEEEHLHKICKGCASNKTCQFLICVNKKKIENCSFCDEFPCDMASGRTAYAAKTIVGITNQEFEEYVLPYCSIERAIYLKKKREEG